jgi:hypothetical protein
MDFSCVSEEIKVFNRKMHKIMKLESNVKILDIKLDRSCYTKHGLHLNIIGKKEVKEMMINQIQTFTTKDKGDIIAQNWIQNLDEHCQIEGIDNISPEVEELQLKDGKEGKEKEDSESENLSDSDCDCDQTVGIHENIIEGKVIRKQREAIVKNVEVEEDKLDNCNRGNNNMNMNNDVEYIPRMMNEKLLQDEHIDSKGSRLSTHSKKVLISRNKAFYGKFETRCIPIAS